MHSLKSKRGTILLVTLLFAGAIAIFLGSFMTISVATLQLSNRSIYANAASDLVDTGLDEVMWIMNYAKPSVTTDWATKNGFTATTVNGVAGYEKTFDYSSHLSNGLSGVVKVWVNPSLAVPFTANGITTTVTGVEAIAQATITLPNASINQSTILKEAETYMVPASLFDGSLVGKTDVSLAGMADSYNSASGPYSAASAGDQAVVGSPDVLSGAVAINGDRVDGSVVTGESSLAAGDVTWSTGGGVGATSWINAGNTGVETGHITYDFTTSFPNVTQPSTSTAIPLDTSVALGTAGTTTTYYTSSDIKNGFSITPGANVIIVFTSSGKDLDLAGNDQITIPAASGSGSTAVAASSLVIYAAGDVSIAGNGVANGGGTAGTANRPVDFQIYGTSTTSQNIAVKGNGVLSGAVYAPNAAITMDGGGSSGAVLGAMVGNTITINGSGNNFHYDDSLASLINPNGLWSASKYRELSSATDRISL
jgi:hypothetical protein